ncbi:ABC transporter ATP-binding protein [Providencia burhodogranariea]|uniref:Nitrate/nitrite transport system ATP-binding protein NrtD n=1 Tax=Providencia burhodogranariea DSM 19968 TaxID=1141662 RepID=K8WLB0_9GAMM|nr:ABC transporter ATP-binding protein [Providencia burhodogranariea]EKT60771.1 nitrate/nitrite transport system ATP-binding protein NrtD [Providencia burhodogranariea DSM 19968]
MNYGAKLQFENVSKHFSGGVHVEIGDLEIKAGQFTILLGRSGCGKTTLLNLAMGLQTPSNGQLFYDEQPLAGMPPDSALLFQQNNLFPWMTAKENINFALQNRGNTKKEANEISLKLLNDFGLAEFADHLPTALSGGMCQRVALARTLAISPRLLLLDEPFSALDAQTRRLMQEQLLNTWKQSGATVVMVTHDLQEALLLADYIVLMASNPYSHIAETLEIKIPRPRQLRSDEIIELQDYLDAFLTNETRIAEHF